MQPTSQQLEFISEIIQRVIANDKVWLNEKEIMATKKDAFWIVNYKPGKSNEFNCLVRGMVFEDAITNDPLSLIRSFPFMRFFNQKEEAAAPVNLSESEMLEKMDGTMVGVFFPNGKPEFHTRKMLSTHEKDLNLWMTSFAGKRVQLLQEIRHYVDKLQFNNLDKEFTYVFEFIHEASYVITKYQPEHYGLYLLGARNLKTYRELTEESLDQVAERIGANRPRRFNIFTDLSEIEFAFKFASETIADFEGFIFRDRLTGDRVKVKDPNYVLKHHMIDNLCYKNLLPLILKGEESEFLSYQPHAAASVEKIKKLYADYVDRCVVVMREWQALGLTPRELARRMFGEEPPKHEIMLMRKREIPYKKAEPAVKDEFMRHLIIKRINIIDETELRLEINNQLSIIALGRGTNNGTPKEVMKLIGLQEEEEFEVDDNN